VNSKDAVFPKWEVPESATAALEHHQRLARSLSLFQQLEAWRQKDYDPQLHGTPDGWVLVLDMTKWGQRDIGERNSKMLLRFNTEPCDSPEAAIEAALQVVQP
jgi:hypothetical protein